MWQCQVRSFNSLYPFFDQIDGWKMVSNPRPHIHFRFRASLELPCCEAARAGSPGSRWPSSGSSSSATPGGSSPPSTRPSTTRQTSGPPGWCTFKVFPTVSSFSIRLLTSCFTRSYSLFQLLVASYSLVWFIVFLHEVN